MYLRARSGSVLNTGSVGVDDLDPEGSRHDRRHVLGRHVLYLLDADPQLVRHFLGGLPVRPGLVVARHAHLDLLHQGEDSGALGHGQVRILQSGVEPESLLQRLRDGRGDGHAADQEHVVEPFDALLPCRRDRPLGDLHGALEQFGGQLAKMLPGQFELDDRAVEPDVVLARLGGAQRLLQLLGRGREILHELLIAARIEVGILLGEAAQQEIDDGAVPVGAAQVMIAVGADDLDVVAVDADDRGVEGPAAEVIDEDVPRPRLILALVERLIVQRGGHRLGQDIEHVQAGYLPGLAGGFALEQPEVGGHGDHHVAHLVAGLLLRGIGQLAQDQRGDRLGGVILPVERVVDVLAHLPFDQLDHKVRGEHGGVLRLPAHDHVVRRLEVDHRGRRVLAHRALQHDRPAGRVHMGDAGVGGAEINSVGSHFSPHCEGEYW